MCFDWKWGLIMNSKIQKKIDKIIKIKDEICLWKEKTEQELACLMKEFEKIPRDEISSHFVKHLKDSCFADILIKIAKQYPQNLKLNLYIISSLCYMISRYNLDETDEIYHLVLSNSTKKDLAGYVCLHLPHLKGFDRYANKWEYFMSMRNFTPKKIAHQKFISIIEQNLHDIPDIYRAEIVEFLQDKSRLANSECGKKFYLDMINKINR